MEMLNQKQKILVIGGVIIIAIIFIFYYINSTKDIYDDEEIENTMEEEVIKKEDIENTIVIHVTGAVKNQGIVTVKENSRINDVIEASGRTYGGGKYKKC